MVFKEDDLEKYVGKFFVYHGSFIFIYHWWDDRWSRNLSYTTSRGGTLGLTIYNKAKHTRVRVSETAPATDKNLTLLSQEEKRGFIVAVLKLDHSEFTV